MNQQTLAGRLERLAADNPDRPAVVDRDQVISRGQLASLCAQIARHLPERSRIGLILDHSREMIAALFAVLVQGSAYIPAEPSFPEDRIARMMNEAGISVILTQKKYADRLQGFPLLFLEDLDLDPERTLPLPADLSEPEDLAYILYTSGTTGAPKGICITNANVCHYVDAFNHEFHVSEDDRMLQYSVCSFDIFTEEVFASLLNGAALVIPSENDRTDVQTLMDFIADKRITILSGFPYLLEKINILPSLPPSLRLLISGGDVLRERFVNRLYQTVDVYNTYGPSETTVCASYFHCLPGTALEDGTFPVGKPVLNVSIDLLDETGKAVEDGQIGEMVISGPGVGLGYLKDHGHENDAFETCPDGSIRYWSGDLGRRLEDGSLAFLKRKDSQVMIYGRRVEIEEVENVLNLCTGIETAVVRDWLDEDGLPYLCAYLVASGSFGGLRALKQELARHLPAFMIPEFFIRMSEIQLNENGKPDRSALPQVLKCADIPWS